MTKIKKPSFKRKKVILLVILLLFSAPLYSVDKKPNKSLAIQKIRQKIETKQKQMNSRDYTLELYKNDPWGFLGKKFYDELYEEYDEEKAKKQLLGFSFLFGATSFFCSCGNPAIFILGLIWIPLFIVLALVIHINPKVEERNELILKKFLRLWSKFKAITPEELHSLFDKLCKQQENLTSNEIQEIINEIQTQVIQHVEKYRDIQFNKLEAKRQLHK